MAKYALTDEDMMYTELYEGFAGFGSAIMFLKKFNYYAEKEVYRNYSGDSFWSIIEPFNFLALWKGSKFVLLDISQVHKGFMKLSTGFRCIASSFKIDFVYVDIFEDAYQPCKCIWAQLPSKIGDLYL